MIKAPHIGLKLAAAHTDYPACVKHAKTIRNGCRVMENQLDSNELTWLNEEHIRAKSNYAASEHDQ